MDKTSRMKLIRRRVSKYRSRYEKRIIGCLGILCACLTAGMGYLLKTKQYQGVFTQQSEYGSVLLHNSGEPYIVIGVIAFICGASFTILCIKLNQRKYMTSGKEGAD